MLSYQDFCAGHKGSSLTTLTGKAEVIASMERQSRMGEPAVAAIDATVAETIGDLDDTERQHAGRVVRDALARHGWRPARRKRVRGGRVFTSGTVYDRAAAIVPPPSAAAGDDGTGASDRLAAARRLLFAGRLDPESPVDTVDAFLKERRAMWSGR